MQLAQAVIKRRARRGSWAYMLGLLFWLPPMFFAAGNLSFHVRAWQLLPLLIPIAAVLVQMAYPTLLGWAVIAMPSGLFTGVIVFFVVVTAPRESSSTNWPPLRSVQSLRVFMCSSMPRCGSPAQSLKKRQLPKETLYT